MRRVRTLAALLLLTPTVGAGGARAAQAAPAKTAKTAKTAGAAKARYQVAPGPGGLWLYGPRGARLLSLSPELDVDLLVGRRRVRRRRLRFGATRVRRSGPRWRVVSSVEVARARYTLTLAGHLRRAAISLRLDARYGRSLRVRHERLRLLSAEPVSSATMLDRALRRVAVPRWRFAWVGALTPQRVWLRRRGARVAVVGGRGTQALLARLRGRTLELLLELDHRRNHPLPRYRCVKRAVLHASRRRYDEQRRRAGQRRSLAARLLVGRTALVTPTRYPEGYRAAYVLTDHADQSRAATFEALAFGRTGALRRGERGSRHRGLINRGLGYTKTVFVARAGPYWKQLDSAAYRKLVGAVGSRVEIGLHTVTGAADRRARVARLLSRFRALGLRARTWIDHQPDTNCEAITNRGWDRRSGYYVLDLLARAGVRFLWNAVDTNQPRGSINLLAPGWWRRRRPLLYGHAALHVAGKPPFALFTTTNVFFRRRRFLRVMRRRALERLVAERGLFVGHVYLDVHRRKGWLRKRALIDRVGRGRYRLSRGADALFVRLARRQKRRELLVGSVERVLGHIWRVRRRVALRHTRRTLVIDARRLRRPLRGLTLRLPRGADGLRVLASSASSRPVVLRGQRRRDGALDVWLDVAPGARHRLAVLARGRRVVTLVDGAGVGLDARVAAHTSAGGAR